MSNIEHMIQCLINNHKTQLRHVTVDTIATKEGQIMLVRRADFLREPGKLALPGGYLQPDETTANGALREFTEETGFQGKITQLFRIIDSPDRRNEELQNISFTYLIDDLEQISDPDQESTELARFALDQLPDKSEFAFDHYQTIQLYLEYLKSPIELPIFN